MEYAMAGKMSEMLSLIRILTLIATSIMRQIKIELEIRTAVN
jgi:hypothetical protein